jgi:chromosomal replication initiator protein
MASGTNGDHAASAWREICARMREEIGEPAYQSWLKPMTLRELADGQVRMSVPTRFMRDWVVAHYADRLLALWSEEVSGVRSIDIVVQPERFVRPQEDSRPAAVPASVTVAESVRPPRADEIREEFGAPLDVRFTFENFVVGKPNEFAYAAARRVAEAASVTFNPLFLYSGVGLGKTHLMHAIAWHIRRRSPERTVVYLSAEKFMYLFIRALREHNTVDFKEMFRNADVLMVDDVQFLGAKNTTQEEFFHTFNALVDQGRQIVLSADKSPSDLEGMEERLISRLNCGLVADIHPTTFELRLGILESKAERLEAAVPKKVLEFLAHKITSNVRELEGALNRVHEIGRAHV